MLFRSNNYNILSLTPGDTIGETSLVLDKEVEHLYISDTLTVVYTISEDILESISNNEENGLYLKEKLVKNICLYNLHQFILPEAIANIPIPQFKNILKHRMCKVILENSEVSKQTFKQGFLFVIQGSIIIDYRNFSSNKCITIENESEIEINPNSVLIFIPNKCI